jgi:hypothetical protein
MATTVNRKTEHDFVTLAITWEITTKLNLTWNRNGEKISYAQAIDPELAAKLLEAARVPNGEPTIGQWIEKVWECAARTRDPIELLTLLRALPRPGEPKPKILPRYRPPADR